MITNRIVLLASLQNATGNNITAERIANFLRCSTTTVELVDVHSFEDNQSFRNWSEKKIKDTTLFVGVHAYRAGKLLLGSCIPYIIIFGGTDINENYKDDKKLAIMKHACKEAKLLICFTSTIKDRALQYFDADISKLCIISPSVEEPCRTKAKKELDEYIRNNGYFDESISIRKWLGISEKAKLFVLPCGIRPVKDPLFLVDLFDNYFSLFDNNMYLLIVGPVLDENYFQYMMEQIRNKKGILYKSNMPQAALHGVMIESNGIINSSKSEGLSNVILEAMYLKIPIIARNIEGNRNIIEHEKTGLLFENPEDIIPLFKQIDNSTFCNTLTNEAYKYVSTNHSVSNEEAGYRNIVK